MTGLVTPLRRARGLGSAKHGVGHFIGQRVTAVALLLLSPWALWSGAHLAGRDYAAVRAWLGSPVNASLLILVVLAGLYHGQLGMRVIIEDYVERPLTRTLLLIANAFVAALGATIATVSILGVMFGGAG
ncbi:MAG TPA: succinate dehydrogenase, hydrophobic membrane anchor protein [Caulobacteraceae bacterium]|nr:succinate dehydrogenase, hydrophobic membrane anchor protein [Caulobacteraceae bacterium]